MVTPLRDTIAAVPHEICFYACSGAVLLGLVFMSQFCRTSCTVSLYDVSCRFISPCMPSVDVFCFAWCFPNNAMLFILRSKLPVASRWCQLGKRIIHTLSWRHLRRFPMQRVTTVTHSLSVRCLILIDWHRSVHDKGGAMVLLAIFLRRASQRGFTHVFASKSSTSRGAFFFFPHLSASKTNIGILQATAPHDDNNNPPPVDGIKRGSDPSNGHASFFFGIVTSRKVRDRYCNNYSYNCTVESKKSSFDETRRAAGGEPIYTVL